MSDTSQRECGECGNELSQEWNNRGRAFQCPQCRSWLYRGLWSRKHNENRCLTCRQPKQGENCVLCQDDHSGSKWQQLVDWATHAPASVQRTQWFPIVRIRVDLRLARLSVDLHEFERLCRSIDELGMIQPIIVRSCGDKQDPILVSGHRRLLAARHLGWRKVPLIQMKISEAEAVQIRLAENTQREALIPLEVADALNALGHEINAHSPKELSDLTGLAESTAVDCLKLLRLNQAERDRLVYGFEQARVDGLPANSSLGGTIVDQPPLPDVEALEADRPKPQHVTAVTPPETVVEDTLPVASLEVTTTDSGVDPEAEVQQLLQTLTRLQQRNRELEAGNRERDQRLQADQIELAHQLDLAAEERRRIHVDAQEARAQIEAERRAHEEELERREAELEQRIIALEKKLAKER